MAKKKPNEEPKIVGAGIGGATGAMIGAALGGPIGAVIGAGVTGSKARRMVAAAFWMCSHDPLIPAMACSPPPAHVAT